MRFHKQLDDQFDLLINWILMHDWIYFLKQINLAMSKAFHVIDLPFCKCKIKFRMSISFLQMQIISNCFFSFFINAKSNCQCLLCGMFPKYCSRIYFYSTFNISTPCNSTSTSLLTKCFVRICSCPPLLWPRTCEWKIISYKWPSRFLNVYLCEVNNTIDMW